MPDPRDPHATERLAERDAAYRAGIAEYRAEHDDEPVDPAVRALAIVECGLCDDDGYRGPYVCDHVDHASESAHGRELVKAELEKIRQRKASAS
jgi:hypothetical protein